MKEITTNNGTFLFIEMPANTTIFKEFTFGSTYRDRVEFYNDNDYISSESISGFKVITTTEGITEEQAETIVEFVCGVNGIGYRDYEIITMVNHKKTAKESLQSLIQANGLDINKNYLIVKKL